MKVLPRPTNISSLVLKFFALLLPFYFLPFTNDLIELNKTVLLFITVFILLGFLVYISYKRKSFVFVTSYTTLPLVLLLVSVVFSTFFSISTNYSYWGYYGSLSNTFWGYVFLVLLAFLVPLFLGKKRDVRSVTFYFLIGSFIVAFHAFLNYFGFLGFLSKTPLFFLGLFGFLSVGSYSVLKVVLVMASVLSLYFILTSEKVYKIIFSAIAITVFLVTSALYFGVLFFAIVMLSILIPLALFREFLVSNKLLFLGIALLVGLVVLSLSSVPSTSKVLNLSNRAQELPTLDTRTSWIVTNGVLGSRPLFGTGLGSFINAYTRFKPSYVNSTIIWDTRFFKPNSFYMLVLAEMGLVGFFALLFLVFSLFYSWFKTAKNPFSIKEYKGKDKYFLFTLRYVVLLLLVSLAFIPGGIFLLASLFLFIALLSTFEMILGSPHVKKQEVGIALNKFRSKSKDSSTGISSLGADYRVLVSYKPVALLVLVIYAFAGYFTYRVFASDIAYRGFFSTPKTLLDVRDNRVRASRINPTSDVYQRGVSNINRAIVFALVKSLNEQKDTLDDNQKKNLINTIQQLLNESSIRLRYVTSDSDFGINVLNWEARGLFYHNLLGIDKNASTLSLQSYLTASALEPSNPRLLASIGSVYYATENYDQAKTYFERAILLKTDYAAAWFNYAKSLEKLNNYVQAYNAVQRVLSLVKQDSNDYKVAKDYLDQLKPKAEAALKKAAQAQKEAQQQALKDKIDVTGESTKGVNANNSSQPQLNQPTKPLNPAPAPTQNSDSNQNDVEAGEKLPVGNNLPNQQPAKEGEGFIENPNP